MMYTRLRDDLGLVYSAGAYGTYKWSAGMIYGYIGCRGDKTVPAISETVNIMKALQQEVPHRDLEQKRLDVLNSFVFNVDTPSDLVEVYARYHMRNEPLDTLGKIQDAYFRADAQELKRLARQYLDPEKLQIFIVADKQTKVNNPGGAELTLEQDVMQLARSLGLPYREIALR